MCSFINVPLDISNHANMVAISEDGREFLILQDFRGKALFIKRGESTDGISP